MSRVNLQHLRYFTVIAESRTIHEAAEKLFITQPTLSRAIASLEDELRVPLFEKAGRNVKITPYGVTFLQYVKTALSALDNGVDTVHGMAQRVEGNFSLASVYGFTYTHLPVLLSNFHQVYPDIYFHLKQAPSQTVIRQIHDGDADFGFHCASSIMGKYDDLESYMVQKSEIVIVAAKDNPLAERQSCSLRNLQSERIVSFDGTSGMYYKTKAMFSGLGLNFTPAIFVSDDQSILNLVCSGTDVACVLRDVAVDNDKVRIIEIEDKVDKIMPIYFSFNKNHVKRLAYNAFKSFVTANAYR